MKINSNMSTELWHMICKDLVPFTNRKLKLKINKLTYTLKPRIPPQLRISPQPHPIISLPIPKVDFVE